ncbi:virulence factor MVIN-like [Nitrobacter sp. Nb-311A]|uniref:murein biosynthesis integral membrane protein MurJ n=1 Tax=unclassified Nitrobacter TaxID=2620411 RepID=UPI0000684B3F|nr:MULTISPECIES: murein biosynthesis integral membrane protein MurJ [unclassified Nitrobacter]EAQ37187.1 virulence factor MVIN-like [Nitrobacter sp. Nb-311A]MCV0386322.1 murein biosynthesis integral membrane protein MurJ [Nitrobacter sp.]
MIRSVLTVSSGNLASRLLGFGRDALTAALLGAGPVADAFLMAFQLISVVRRMLAEGALNAALVPAWMRLRETSGLAAALAFAGNVLATVSATLIVVTVIASAAMPLLMRALAPGFAGSESMQLAITDLRLMLPYLAFAGPTAVIMGLLNARHRFAIPAFLPLLFNGALVLVAVLLLSLQQEPHFAALMMAATVGAAGLLQLVVLALLTRRHELATPLRISFASGMRDFAGKAVPGMVANSGPQLLIVAGAILASTSPSAVSWLYFANRLIELPLGMVGVAIGTVLVPEITRALTKGDRAAMVNAESRGIELAAALALPAAIGLIVLSEPIVRVLFEHGAFTAADTRATALTLGCLGFGLPAYVVIKALSPAFFARGNTMTPLMATLKGIAVAMVLALVLERPFGVAGIAVAVALGAWSSAVSLIRSIAATFGFSIDAEARRRLPRIGLAAFVMGGVLWLAVRLAGPVSGANGLLQAATLAVLIAAGVAIYGLLLWMLRVIDRNDIQGALIRSRSGDLRA